MARGQWERLAPLTGIAAVVFWVLGVLLLEGLGDNPGDDATAQDILAYLGEDENAVYLGAIGLFVGSMFLIWFAGTLRAAVADAEGGASWLAPIVFGTGVATAVLSCSVFAPQVSGAFATNERDAPLTPEAAQALWVAGDGFFVATEYAVAAFLIATWLAVLRWRILPRWVGWLGLLVAIVALFPPIGWAALIFGFPIWIVIASLLLLRRRAPAPGLAATD
jgi:hypothetical protein